MDYEKAYKEALERAKKELKTCGSMDCDAAKQIFRFFPELKKSDDERIRKEIISIVKSYRESCVTEGNHRFDNCIAWLEKQGKSYTKKDVDDAWLKGICDAKRELEKQGEQKPAWSEEDEEQLDRAIYMMEQLDMTKSWDDVYNWLKSLKDRLKGE